MYISKIDVTGKVFGRWKVLKKLGYRKEKHDTYYLCECSCVGNQKEIAYQALKTNQSKSCGCLRIENSRKMLTGNKHNRLPKGEGGLNRIILTYIKNAQSRDLPFSLSKDEVKMITSQNCFYCGDVPNLIAKTTPRGMTEEGLYNSKYTYNGIDRIDNDKGYNLDNCVPCCNHCNWSKKDLTQEQFFLKIKKIYEKHFESNYCRG